MKKSITIGIIAVIATIFVSSTIDNAYGVISYPTNFQRLLGSPTYCIVEPQGVSDDAKFSYMNQAISGVADWQKKLQENLSNPDLWKMNSKIITTRTSGDGCDITIYFKETVKQISTKGYTTIGIFYHGSDKIEIAYKNIISGKIFNIILHEIGHSLGLGHYVSDDNSLNKKWYSGNEPPPSIMIPTTHQVPKLMSITGIDAFKVFEIYGSNGFYAFSPKTPTIPTPPTPIIPPITPISPIKSIEISDVEIILNKYDTEIVKISGELKNWSSNLAEGVFITVKEPGTGFVVHSVLHNNKGYFELPMVFDNNSKKGWYEVEVSYNGHLDRSSNFQFYVGEKPWGLNPIPEKYVIPEPEIAPDTRIVSGEFFEGIVIGSKNNEYEVKAYLKRTPETESGIRVTAENACPLKKQIFQKDFRYISGNEVSFTFYQSGQGKPDECSIHFTVTNFDGEIINIIIANYVVEKSNLKTDSTKPFVVQPDVDKTTSVPEWIKNNAAWWAEDQINDPTFVNGIQYMIQNKIINILELPEKASEVTEQTIPKWIKTNAGWWADGRITEDDFLNGIEYLVTKGIIKLD